FLSADDCTFVPAAAGDDCEIQSRLVSNALYRSAALARFDGICFDVLFDLAKGILPRLARTSEVFAVFDVGGNRPLCQQLEGCNGSAAGHQEQLQENTEISNRK